MPFEGRGRFLPWKPPPGRAEKGRQPAGKLAFGVEARQDKKQRRKEVEHYRSPDGGIGPAELQLRQDSQGK